MRIRRIMSRRYAQTIPLHTSDLILAALSATDLPDKRFALPLF